MQMSKMLAQVKSLIWNISQGRSYEEKKMFLKKLIQNLILEKIHYVIRNYVISFFI